MPRYRQRGAWKHRIHQADGSSGAYDWLMRDQFADDRVAGAVNGTYASDDYNLRTVADTESKVITALGALTFAGGKAAAAYGDPAYWLPITIDRQAGRILSLAVKYSDAGAVITGMVGYDVDQASFPTEAVLRFASAGSLDTKIGDWIVVGQWLVNTVYQIAICLRAAGHFILIKGGAFAEWTLLPSSETGNATPLAPAISNYSGIGTIDYISVPRALWLPAPIASDSFAIDGALAARLTDGLGHAETSGPGSGGDGKTWAGATWTTAGGVALNTPTPGADMFKAGAGTFESGTYSWTAYGGNSIANVGNALVITYVDQANGANVALNNAGDLSANLSIGTWYQLQLDAKVNEGSTVNVLLYDGAAGVNQTITSTGYTTLRYTFRAINATSYILMMAGMAAGEVITLDNLTLRPLTLSELHSCLTLLTSDVIIETAITRATATQAGLALRLDSASAPANGVYVYLSGSNLICATLVAGVWAIVSTTAITYGDGYVLRVDCSGTVYRTYYNGAFVAENIISKAGINDNTIFGLFGTRPETTFTYALVYAKGTEAQYNLLDRRLVPEAVTPQFEGVFGIGDSKMNATLSTWFSTLMVAIDKREAPTRYAFSGYTVAQMAEWVTAFLPLETQTPTHILMNLGANDVASLPAEATWKADYTSIIDACLAKWPLALIYIAKPWRRTEDVDCATIAGWIDDIIATYATNVYVGHDEQGWLEGGDDGATMTSDGTHYSVAGNAEAVAQWRTIIGL